MKATSSCCGRRIDRRRRTAGTHDGEVGQDPLDPGAGGDGDSVLRSNAERRSGRPPAGRPCPWSPARSARPSGPLRGSGMPLGWTRPRPGPAASRQPRRVFGSPSSSSLTRSSPHCEISHIRSGFEVNAGSGGQISADASQLRRSRMTAIPWPPPTHIVSSPSATSCSRMALSRVVMIRAPVEPKGWPRAIAPPCTFSRSWSSPRSRSRGDHLHRERLVDLDQVDVADGQSGVGQRPSGRLDRAETHDLGAERADPGRDDPGQRSQSQLGGPRVTHDHHRRRAVVQRAAVPGGDGTVGAEDRLAARRPPPAWCRGAARRPASPPCRPRG